MLAFNLHHVSPPLDEKRKQNKGVAAATEIGRPGHHWPGPLVSPYRQEGERAGACSLRQPRVEVKLNNV